MAGIGTGGTVTGTGRYLKMMNEQIEVSIVLPIKSFITVLVVLYAIRGLHNITRGIYTYQYSSFPY